MDKPATRITPGEPGPSDDPIQRDAGEDGTAAPAAPSPCASRKVRREQFIREVRKFYAGPLIVGGAITTGTDIRDTIKLGADFAYMGTRFIATNECQASDDYKQMVVDAREEDVVLTPYFTGVPAHFLMPSILNAGIDPSELDKAAGNLSFDTDGNTGSAWKDIWSAGKGVEYIHEIMLTAELVKNLTQEYAA